MPDVFLRSSRIRAAVTLFGALAVSAAPAASIASAHAHQPSRPRRHPVHHRAARNRPARPARPARAVATVARGVASPTGSSTTRRTSPAPARGPVTTTAPASTLPTFSFPSAPSGSAPPAAPAASISAPAVSLAAPALTSTPTATTSGSTPAPASAWGEPALVNPVTVQIGPTTGNVTLNQSLDYILQCPSSAVPMTATLNVWGGHNVVMQNCALNLTTGGWAAAFKNQTGTLWIHDVHFGGIGLTGGIQLQEPSATVVMRDVLFDTVYGSYTTNHAELIQTWSGPARLLIDGLTGTTMYQGLFLLPNQYNSGPAPTVFDLRNIDINDTQGAYAMWLGDVTGAPATNQSAGIATWNVANVFVNPNPSRSWNGWWLWPKPSSGDPSWNNVSSGVPAAGSFVHATTTGAAGVDEGVSPTALTGEHP